MTIITGVNFRPEKVGHKSSKIAVSQKLEKKRDFSIHRKSKNVHIWRHNGRRDKMRYVLESRHDEE